MSFIDNKISDRMGGKDFFSNTKSYKFEKIKKAKEEAILNNPNIPFIDMGIGEPDKAADKAMVDILYMEAGKP
ncbi:MAG TPA: LL-diaminopimelate aminotransferase, partial [Peptostreptococcaceae bacterium]|nr:LL-diaminopimelate aminotransferase [Peptostreptococcaceae bacterium]